MSKMTILLFKTLVFIAHAKKERLTLTSAIVPDANVSPGRGHKRAAAAVNMQKQGLVMQRRATQSQGGYEELPLGLVVRHHLAKEDRTKCDPATMQVVIVAKPGVHTYTIANKAGYLEKNIEHMYRTLIDI